MIHEALAHCANGAAALDKALREYSHGQIHLQHSLALEAPYGHNPAEVLDLLRGIADDGLVTISTKLNGYNIWYLRVDRMPMSIILKEEATNG